MVALTSTPFIPFGPGLPGAPEGPSLPRGPIGPGPPGGPCRQQVYTTFSNTHTTLKEQVG